jgi:hypothetical protein
MSDFLMSDFVTYNSGWLIKIAKFLVIQDSKKIRHQTSGNQTLKSIFSLVLFFS